jgi:hypothetical protein
MKYVMMGKTKKKHFKLIIFCSYRIILESDPMLITQRVQLRQDDIPLGEQTVSQVRYYKLTID